MAGRAVSFLWLGLGLGGCAGPIGLYHSAEGGAIAQARQPPPGADAPYPNLASVPAAPVGVSAVTRAEVDRRLAGPGFSNGVSAPSPLALEGLALPGAPPPEPDVPDLVIPQAPPAAAAMVAAVPPAPAPVAAKAPSAPVALAFQPGSAVLDPDAAVALRGVAAAAGAGSLLVGGFGESDGLDGPALALALARARRLADALTADGVAPAAIRLVAAAGGSGGFVQLFY